MALPLGAVAVHDGPHERIDELSHRLQHSPHDIAALLERAELLRRRGDYRSAHADVRCARLLAPIGRPDISIADGRLLAAMGCHEQARLRLGACLEEPGVSAAMRLDALRERASVHASLGEWSAAAADWTHVIELEARPQAQSYLERFRSQLELGAGAADLALRGLDEGLVALGPAPALQLAAIELEASAGRFDAALERLETLASSGGRHARWLTTRGDLQRRAGRSPAARQDYLAALRSIAQLEAGRRRTRANLELAQRLRERLTELETLHGRPAATARRR